MDGDRRQVHAVGHVANGIDIADRGARELVDHDMAVPAEIDTGLVEPKPHGVGKPAGGGHDQAGMETVAAFEMDAVTSIYLFDAGGFRVDADVDAALAHRLGQPVAQVGIEIAQDLIAAMDHGDLHAEPGEDRGELHADIARPNDGDARRQLFELKAFVGADQMLGAWQLGDHRMAAGGDQDGLGADRRIAVREPHRVRIIEHGAVKNDAHAGLLQRPRIDAVQPIDLAPDIADQRRPVEAQALAGPAEIARVGEGAPNSGCHRRAASSARSRGSRRCRRRDIPRRWPPWRRALPRACRRARRRSRRRSRTGRSRN